MNIIRSNSSLRNHFVILSIIRFVFSYANKFTVPKWHIYGTGFGYCHCAFA